MKQLEKRIKEIRSEISSLGDIRPGSLTQQSRSVKGEEYGQYWSLSYTFNGKSRTDYVSKKAIDQVRRETENFKKLRELIDEWTELSIELSKSKIKLLRDKKLG